MLELKRKGIAGGPMAERVLQRRPREISWWAGFFFHSSLARVGIFVFSLSFYFHFCSPLSHHACVVPRNIIVISSVRGLRRMAAGPEMRRRRTNLMKFQYYIFNVVISIVIKHFYLSRPRHHRSIRLTHKVHPSVRFVFILNLRELRAHKSK